MSEYKEPTVNFIQKVVRAFGVDYFNNNESCNKGQFEKITNHIEELYDFIDNNQSEFQRMWNLDNQQRNEIAELKQLIEEFESKKEIE